jgi:hypothetical protein
MLWRFLIFASLVGLFASEAGAEEPTVNCAPPSQNVGQKLPARSPYGSVNKIVAPKGNEELCIVPKNVPYTYLKCVGQGWPPNKEYDNWICETNGACGGGKFSPTYFKSVNGVQNICLTFANDGGHEIKAIANYYYEKPKRDEWE